MKIKSMKKKLALITMAAVVALSVTACGGGGSDKGADKGGDAK